MKQKLYNLKMKILRDKSISDDLKEDLANEIFKIEMYISKNETKHCTCDYPLIRSDINNKEYCAICNLNLNKNK